MNAIDALPEGGNIFLDLFETQDPKGYEIQVRDTGQGIPQEVMDNLFDPFFTTKEEGLGLGLYISKRIIKDHNGSLQVESNVILKSYMKSTNPLPVIRRLSAHIP